MSSDVIKKGWLDVKRKNIFGPAYKQKFVVLRNSLALRCKTVEIQDGEAADESGEIIPLGDVWTVQDKPSKSRGRYAFELIMGEEAVLTFSCSSVVEREEWTESFQTLKKQLSYGTGQSPPISDFFSVVLVKNRSALEIGHSGQYLLSIRDNAIVLHWRTGAIAHHWPRKSVLKLSIDPEREGHLILQATRIGSSGHQLEFDFVTDNSRCAVQILKLWNITLLESMGPEKLNEISSFLNTTKKSTHKKSSKSFRTKKSGDGSLRRTGSLSKSHTLGTRRGPPPVVPRGHEDLTRSWGGPHTETCGNLSQDSYFAPDGKVPSRYSASPPPLPPRPDDSSDEDDPDYAYIDEKKVKGPGNQPRPPTPTLEDQLKDLERSIKRENKAKKREQKQKSQTLKSVSTRERIAPSFGPRLSFVAADPEDYMDPVPSKKIPQKRPKSTSSDRGSDYEIPVFGRSLSQPRSLSQLPFDEIGPPKDHSPARAESPMRISPTRREENPPTLPPRTWRGSSTTSNVSLTSANSLSSVGGGTSKNTNIDDLDSSPSFPSRSYRLTSSSNEDPSSPKAVESIKSTIIPEEPSPEMTSPATEQTTARHSPLSDAAMIEPPPLPPRSPIKEHVSRQSSCSSVTSNSSTRCPRCRTKRIKSQVSKTVSLTYDQTLTTSPQDEDAPQGSLPDLNTGTSIPENSLINRRHKHSSGSCNKCSPASSTDGFLIDSNSSLPSAQNVDYLQLLVEPGNDNDQYLHLQPTSPPSMIDTELQSELDKLTSFVLTLENLENENKVTTKNVSGGGHQGEPPERSREEQKRVRTNFDAALRQTQQVHADLCLPPRRAETIANGDTPSKKLIRSHPPLQKHQTIAAIPFSSNDISNTFHMNGSLPQHRPPPPVPPRSLVSLGVQTETKAASDRQSPKGGSHRSLGRQTITGSLHNRQSPDHTKSRKVANGKHSPKSGSHRSLGRQSSGHRHGFNHTFEDTESSTVFIHHIKDRRSTTKL